jgi:hypothetical protein
MKVEKLFPWELLLNKSSQDEVSSAGNQLQMAAAQASVASVLGGTAAPEDPTICGRLTIPVGMSDTGGMLTALSVALRLWVEVESLSATINNEARIFVNSGSFLDHLW